MKAGAKRFIGKGLFSVGWTKGLTVWWIEGMAKRMTAINQVINAEYIFTDKPDEPENIN